MDEKIKTELKKVYNKISRASGHIKTTALLMTKAKTLDEIDEYDFFNCMDLFETEAELISEQNEIIADMYDPE